MSYCESTREEILKIQRMPIINTIDDLANELLISDKILKKISLHSYTYYKEFYIPKKSNNNEMRKIAAPKYTLKVIQAWILRNVLEKAELHRCAMAYRKGVNFGIKSNANIHKEKVYIMKVDFKDFFFSITKGKVFFMFNEFGYSKDISNLFADICTYKGLLPQGAVTSPYITNILLKEFDEKMYEYCMNNYINYSRYSDDLTLSCNRRRPLENAKDFLMNLIKNYHCLQINSGKSFKIYGSDTAKIVTGLLVNNEDVRVTRQYRRLVRAQIYNEIKVNGNNPDSEMYGKLAFIRNIDKDTFDQLVVYINKLGIENKFKIEFLQQQ